MKIIRTDPSHLTYLFGCVQARSGGKCTVARIFPLKQDHPNMLQRKPRIEGKQVELENLVAGLDQLRDNINHE